MTTAELLNLATPWGPLGDCQTVYRGPCRDRQTLRQAAASGDLCFSVNRSHVGAPLGARLTLGYYDNFAEAEAIQKYNGRPYRISAHCRGWGHPEECDLSFVLSVALRREP